MRPKGGLLLLLVLSGASGRPNPPIPPIPPMLMFMAEAAAWGRRAEWIGLSAAACARMLAMEETAACSRQQRRHSMQSSLPSQYPYS